MGAVANLNRPGINISDGYDALVVRENYTAVDGGVTLDTTGFAPLNIRAGHVIIRETGTDNYKPMPVNAGATAYAALPAGHEYFGHAVQSVLTALPLIGVTYHAKINPLVVFPAQGYYDMAPILDDLKEALTHVIYKGDKE